MFRALPFYKLLVGGAFTTIAERVGLWCWTLDNISSNANINNGARLIILEYTQLMGFDVFCTDVFLCIPLLLSAVDMIMVLMLACGIGIVGILLVLLTLTSVLDLLYLKYTLRNLVCWLGFSFTFLVGGAFDGTYSYAGLWYWWVAEYSSYYGITTGARPLI